MIKRFGLYKYLPVGRFRMFQPVTRLIPDRLVPYFPPSKVGSVEMMVPDMVTIGEVWISSSDPLEFKGLPKALYRYEVVGIDGFPVFPGRGQNHPMVTNGHAIELIAYLEQLFDKAKKKRENSKIKVAIGGSNPDQVSTVARLLSRQVDEMVLVGEEPFFRRLAGRIMAETGLAVRLRSYLPNEHFDRVIDCGGTSLMGIPCDRLFTMGTPLKGQRLFPWALQASSEPVMKEIQSFAAAEAMLIVAGGWGNCRIIPGILSLAWVEYIGKLMQDLNFQLPLEALDTPPPVGYNVNNL